MTIAPLNGIKTHPLSDHAKGVLERVKGSPVPCYLINPGVINRLQREGCVEVVEILGKMHLKYVE